VGDRRQGNQRCSCRACGDVAKKAAAYLITAEAVDGMDVLAVEEAARRAVAGVRSGNGPFFLECKTYRFRAHSMYDPELYRSKAEVEEWKKKDPVKLYRAKLLEMAVCTARDLDEIDQRMEKEIDEAVMFAQSSQEPEAEDALNDIYVGPYIP
jgi:TPP-dependent pyruvate/acetoin dehydrogenase alpha subunit